MQHKIALFYEGHTNPNGSATFTEQIYRMLSQAGHDVIICNMRKSRRRIPRKLYYGSSTDIFSITVDDALELMRTHRCMITQLPTSTYDEERKQWHINLLENGAASIIHGGPGKMEEQLCMWAFEAAKDNCMVVMRPALVEAASQAGYTHLVKMPHPYIRRYDSFERPVSKYHAVNIGRVSSEKRTDIVCEANEQLPQHMQIKIFGAITGRIFVFRKLSKKYPM